MDYEIFLKIFVEPQNIFICSPFLFFFEHKMSKLVIKEIQEKQGILKKTHPLSRCKANGGKDF